MIRIKIIRMKYLHLIINLFLISKMYAVFQTISQPGLYQLGENVTYSPAVPNDIIFQITASDVEFDLGDRFITQNSANTQTGLIAIQVASGLSNVVIKSGTNGSIQNIRGTGIQVLSSCSRVLLDNITTFSCEERGIDFVGGSGTEITNSQIQNCKVIQCSIDPLASAPISLTFCNDLLVLNMNADFNGPTDFFSTFNVDTCTRCNFDAITIRENTTVSGWTGFFLNLCSNGNFKNCSFENNTTAGSATGYNLNGCSLLTFQNCQIIGTASTGGQVNGFFSVASNDILFNSCLVEGMTNSADSVLGYVSFADTRMTFLNSSAQNNSSTANNAEGFVASSSNSVSFINCIANNQTASNNAIGFDINSCIDPYMQESLATLNVGAVSSFGILASGNTNQVFVLNVASRNGAVAGDQFNGVAAGAVNSVLATTVNSAAIGPWTNLGLT